MEQNEFRRVMGHFATGVTVVTCRGPGDEPVGLTASAVASVSLAPTLLLVCVERTAESHQAIREAGGFAVNVLGHDGGERLARRFSESGQVDRFRGVAYREAGSGAPILESALAWFDCRLDQVVEAGDHGVFLGEALAGDAGEGVPLLYYRGGYGRLHP